MFWLARTPFCLFLIGRHFSANWHVIHELTLNTPVVRYMLVIGLQLGMILCNPIRFLHFDTFNWTLMVDLPPGSTSLPWLKLLLRQQCCCDAYWETVPEWMMLNTKTSEVYIRLTRHSATRLLHQYMLPIVGGSRLPVSASKYSSQRGSHYWPLAIF